MNMKERRRIAKAIEKSMAVRFGIRLMARNTHYDGIWQDCQKVEIKSINIDRKRKRVTWSSVGQRKYCIENKVELLIVIVKNAKAVAWATTSAEEEMAGVRQFNLI